MSSITWVSTFWNMASFYFGCKEKKNNIVHRLLYTHKLYSRCLFITAILRGLSTNDEPVSCQLPHRNSSLQLLLLPIHFAFKWLGVTATERKKHTLQEVRSKDSLCLHVCIFPSGDLTRLGPPDTDLDHRRAWQFSMSFKGGVEKVDTEFPRGLC